MVLNSTIFFNHPQLGLKFSIYNVTVPYHFKYSIIKLGDKKWK